MVGFWGGRERPIPGRFERRQVRNLLCVPWNYYDDDYDPDKKPEVIERESEPSRERLDMLSAWREFKMDGGMVPWP